MRPLNNRKPWGAPKLLTSLLKNRRMLQQIVGLGNFKYTSGYATKSNMHMHAHFNNSLFTYMI